MEGIVLELRGRDFGLHHRVGAFPVRIGRALDNDLIISHPSVSPHHAELILRDDQVVLRDLDSHNGIRPRKGKRSDELTIPNDGMEVELGHARLAIHTPRTPLQETMLVGCNSPWQCVLHSWVVALGLVLMVLLVGLDQMSLDSSEPIQARDIGIYLAVAILILGLSWFAYALIARVTNHRWESGANLVMVGLMTLLSDWLAADMGHAANYFFNRAEIDLWLDVGVFLLVIPLISYFFARRVSGLNPLAQRGYVLASLLFGGLLAFSTWTTAEDTVQVGDHFHAVYPSELAIHDIRLAPNQSPHDFFEQAKHLEPPK